MSTATLGVANLYGSAGNDVLLVDGGAGNDAIRDRRGRDVLLGRTGNDIIDGGLDDYQWYLTDANVVPEWASYTGEGVRSGQFEPARTGQETLDYQRLNSMFNKRSR